MTATGRIGAKPSGVEVTQKSIAMLQKKANTAKGLTGNNLKLAESLGLIVPKKEGFPTRIWNSFTNTEGQKTFQPDSKKVAQFATIHDERQSFGKKFQTQRKNVEFYQTAINGTHAELEAELGNLNREQTGRSFSLNSLGLEVNLPADGTKKQALFKTHDELTKLKGNLIEAENKLAETQNSLKSSSTAPGAIQERITSEQRQVDTLKNQVEGKRKAIKNILLDADNQALEERFNIHTKGVKDSEAEIALTRKMLEENAEFGNDFIRKPVPPAKPAEGTNPVTQPAEGTATQPAEAAQAATNGNQEAQPAEAKVKEAETKEKEWHNDWATCFNGKATEENPAVFAGMTLGGMVRTFGGITLLSSAIKSAWDALFGKKEPTAADLAVYQARMARGGAV